MTGQPKQPTGLLASFDGAEPLLGAVRELRARGYRCLDAYTPFPVEGLPQALGLRRSRMPLVMLAGGLAGGRSALPARSSGTIDASLGASGAAPAIPAAAVLLAGVTMSHRALCAGNKCSCK